MWMNEKLIFFEYTISLPYTHTEVLWCCQISSRWHQHTTLLTRAKAENPTWPLKHLIWEKTHKTSNHCLLGIFALMSESMCDLFFLCFEWIMLLSLKKKARQKDFWFFNIAFDVIFISSFYLVVMVNIVNIACTSSIFLIGSVWTIQVTSNKTAQKNNKTLISLSSALTIYFFFLLSIVSISLSFSVHLKCLWEVHWACGKGCSFNFCHVWAISLTVSFIWSTAGQLW